MTAFAFGAKCGKPGSGGCTARGVGAAIARRRPRAARSIASASAAEAQRRRRRRTGGGSAVSSMFEERVHG